MRHKRTLTTFVIMLLSSMLLLSSVSAEGTPKLEMRTNSSYVEVDKNIRLSIDGKDIADAYAFEFHLYYDDKLVEPVLSSLTSPITGVTVPATTYKTSSGESYVVLAHTKVDNKNMLSGDVTFFNIQFKSKRSGLAQFSIPYVKFIDSAIRTTTPVMTAEAAVSIFPKTNDETIAAPGTEQSQNTYVVDARQLATTEGKVEFKVAEHIEEIHLPTNTAQLLDGKSLKISNGQFSLDIPAGVFTQLAKLQPLNELGDYAIIISMLAAADNKQASELEKKMNAYLNAETKITSPIYELKLSVVNKTGATHTLDVLDYPVTVQLVNDAAEGFKGVYYISEAGELKFISGQQIDQGFVAKLQQIAPFALVEINKQFDDVSTDHWAYEVINQLFARQLVTGTSSTTFDPNRHVTRAEFTTMIARALQLEVVVDASFDDVADDAWYSSAVSAAWAAGIIKGDQDNKFNPQASITREEMAAMIVRAYEAYYGANDGVIPAISFKDGDQISSWAKDFVAQGTMLGLMKGRSDQAFVPKGNLTRAEAVQVIYNLIVAK